MLRNAKITVMAFLFFLMPLKQASGEEESYSCSRSRSLYAEGKYTLSASFLKKCLMDRNAAENSELLKLKALLGYYMSRNREFLENGLSYLEKTDDPAFQYLLAAEALQQRNYSLTEELLELKSIGSEKQEYFSLPPIIGCSVPPAPKRMPLSPMPVSDDMRISAKFQLYAMTAARKGRDSSKFLALEKELKESPYQRNNPADSSEMSLYSNPKKQSVYLECMEKLKQVPAGDRQSAENYLTLLHKNRIAIFRTPSSYYSFGSFLLDKNKPHEALFVFRRALENAGWPGMILESKFDLPPILRKLSETYAKMNRDADAKTALDAALILELYYGNQYASKSAMEDALMKKTSENLNSREGLLYRIHYFSHRDEIRSGKYRSMLKERDEKSDMHELRSAFPESYPY